MSEELDDNLEKEENSNGFQLDFEEITPWNGANDTGKDVRMKWLRNFEKIRQNFELLSGLWSLKIDSDGKKYAYTNFPIVGAAGMTMFAGEEIKVDSIFKGLPIDTETLQWVDGVLTVVGGTGGGEAGFVKWQNIEGKPSWITTEKPKYSYTEITGLTEELEKYVTLSTDQSITGMKDFANGMKVSGVLFKVINGVLTLDCSIAVTGGFTAYALGEQTTATIMDGIAVDGTTITKENGVLKVVGDIGGASNWDELEGKPSWITDTKPTYAWGEITQKPTTLSGYGIQASDVLNVLKTVDGSGSGLDADTLDGVQGNQYFQQGGIASSTSNWSSFMSNKAYYVTGVIPSDGPSDIYKYGTLVVFDSGGNTANGGAITQIYFPHSSEYQPQYRTTYSRSESRFHKWVRLARTTDNVASATKLQTARTIWGQSFDGTANVTGSLTSVTDITGTGTFTGANIKATDSVYVNGIRLHKTADGVITLEGNLAVTGGITAYADGEDSGGTGGGVIVIDNLTSTLTDAALSANQGRVLKDLIDSKVSNWGELEGKPTTIAGYGISASDVLSTLKTVDGSGSGLDADLLDGVHLISNGYGAGVKRTFFFPSTSQVSSYIKLGTLKTVAVTGSGSSKVIFTVRGGINFGGTNESVYEVAASTRGSIQVTSTLVRGNRELKFGYVSTSSNVEIWMAYDGTYRGTTEVEVSASSSFTITMTETTTKPSGFIEGSYRILAATTDNVASATNADKLDGVHLNGIFTALSSSSGTNLSATIGGVTKSIADLYATTAEKLTTNAGASNRPVYFANGVPVAGSYTFGNANGNAAINNGTLCTNLNADMVDGLHSISLTRSYNSASHNAYMCLGTLTLPQNGYAARLYLVSGNGYNANEIQSRVGMIILRTSNGNASGGKYYAGHVESYRYGMYNIYVVQNSSTSFTLWTDKTNYTGAGYISVDTTPTGTNFTSSTQTSSTLPSNSVKLPLYQVAYTDSNVASATKLQTARNLWGQSFDGTKDVTGSMTVNGNITIANGSSSTLTLWDSSAYLQQQNISDLGGYGLYLYGSSGTRIANKLVVDNNTYIKGSVNANYYYTNGYGSNYIGIGNGDNATFETHNMKIHAHWGIGIHDHTDTCRIIINARTGDIATKGGGTFYSSDIRAKTIIERPKLSLNSIANAPVIKFKWNGYNGLKDDNKLHVGGVAQYIEKILPECVVGQKDDFLSFDYATTGYIFSVLTARHLLSYETRTDRIIRKLKERIKRLEKQLNIENHEEVSIVAD